MLDEKNQQLCNIQERLMQFEVQSKAKKDGDETTNNGTDAESSGISPYTDSTAYSDDESTTTDCTLNKKLQQLTLTIIIVLPKFWDRTWMAIMVILIKVAQTTWQLF
jgi:hypothetical protein